MRIGPHPELVRFVITPALLAAFFLVFQGLAYLPQPATQAAEQSLSLLWVS